MRRAGNDASTPITDTPVSFRSRDMTPTEHPCPMTVRPDAAGIMSRMRRYVDVLSLDRYMAAQRRSADPFMSHPPCTGMAAATMSRDAPELSRIICSPTGRLCLM